MEPAGTEAGCGKRSAITSPGQLPSPLIFLISNSLQITTLEIKQALGVGWKGGTTKVLLVFCLLFTKKCLVVKDKDKTMASAPENEQMKALIVGGALVKIGYIYFSLLGGFKSQLHHFSAFFGSPAENQTQEWPQANFLSG